MLLAAASLLRAGHLVNAVERRYDAEGNLEEDRVILSIGSAIRNTRCEVSYCGSGGQEAADNKEPEKGGIVLHHSISQGCGFGRGEDLSRETVPGGRDRSVTYSIQIFPIHCKEKWNFFEQNT